jgi:hypothetical protein
LVRWSLEECSIEHSGIEHKDLILSRSSIKPNATVDPDGILAPENKHEAACHA